MFFGGVKGAQPAAPAIGVVLIFMSLRSGEAAVAIRNPYRGAMWAPTPYGVVEDLD